MRMPQTPPSLAIVLSGSPCGKKAVG